MKTSIKLVLVYALLLVLLSLTLSSCIFHKHTTKSISSTDSTAYQRTESSLVKHQEEAWNNYLNRTDSSLTKLSFYGPVDTFYTPDSIKPIRFDGNYILFNADGSIIAKGNIKDVVHKSVKQNVKIDSATKKSFDSSNRKEEYKTDVSKKEKDKAVVKESEPDYWGYVKIGAVLLLIVAVVRKWASIKAKVIGFGKGLFTNFFS